MGFTAEQIAWAVKNAGTTVLGHDGPQPLDILIETAREVVYLRQCYESAVQMLVKVEMNRSPAPIIIQLGNNERLIEG